MSQSTWSPLLARAERRDALAAVLAIAEDLQRLVDTELDMAAWRRRGVPGGFLGLATGLPGIALFFTYLAASLAKKEYAQRAEDLVEQSVEILEEDTVPEGLFLGFTGVAWMLEHLRRMRCIETEGFPSEAAVVALTAALSGADWPGAFDVVHGLVGFGILALEADDSQARKLLSLVVGQLEERSEDRCGGKTWRTRPDEHREDLRAIYFDGSFNLGLAHGVPGVLAFLNRAAAHESAAAALADATERWLLQQRLPEGAASVFPSRTYPGTEAEPTRLGWCYGDMGVAAALMVRPSIEAQSLARELFLKAAGRSQAESGVLDMGLCHGSAGVAHLFNDYHQRSGEPWAAAAARRWYQITLRQRRDGGLGGFYSLWPDEAGWQRDPALLTGAAGIGLALLAAATETPPDWQRVFLL
jgi:lantibiotic modifying enzyme